MANLKRIRLCFHSNIYNYEIVIYDGNRLTNYFINNQYQLLDIYSNSSNITLVAIPLCNEYSGNLCFKLNVLSKDCFDLYLNFNKGSQERESLNTFYLIDRNYGLPLSGILIFRGN